MRLYHSLGCVYISRSKQLKVRTTFNNKWLIAHLCTQYHDGEKREKETGFVICENVEYHETLS